jgi:L-lactate dehydrogenase (cytochrome)
MRTAYFENRDAFQRYFLRPRVLVGDVTNSTTETTFMGIKTSIPVFIAPAAMAKLGHPLGEVNLTKAAGACGIVQAVSRRPFLGPTVYELSLHF